MVERSKHQIYQITAPNQGVRPVDRAIQWQSRVVNARVERRLEVKK